MSDPAEPATSALKYQPATVFPIILERLKAGESLRQICNDEGMPDESVIREWAERPEWIPHYARAREVGWSRVGEELLEIADDSRNDWMDRETEKGRVERVIDREALERTRLRLDTRKWMLAKMLPKVYGDKLAIDVSGPALIVALADMTQKAADAEPIDVEALPHVEAPQDEPPSS